MINLALVGCSKNDDQVVLITPPILETTSIASITPTTASVSGRITSEGDTPVIARGICWSTQQAPTLSDNKTIESNILPNDVRLGFSGTISELSLNTTYYVRTYATNTVATGYGNALSFTTPSCQEFVSGSIIYEIDKVYQLLIGSWELYHKYEYHTSQIGPGQFAHNDLHWYYCANRERLVFNSDLSASSISEFGIVTPLGNYYVNVSPDGFLQVGTTSQVIGKIWLYGGGRHLTIWEWTNVQPGKIYDSKGSVYVRSN